MLATGIAATPKLRDLKPLDLTQDEVHSIFELQDGKLFWRVKHKRVSPGDLAGAPQSNGYWRIGINGRSYKRSRLIWLYVHGADSYPRFIDHINRDRSDDRIENLRLVTHAENQQNRSWGISRCRYVYREGNRWRARVSTAQHRNARSPTNWRSQSFAPAALIVIAATSVAAATPGKADG